MRVWPGPGPMVVLVGCWDPSGGDIGVGDLPSTGRGLGAHHHPTASSSTDPPPSPTHRSLLQEPQPSFLAAGRQTGRLAGRGGGGITTALTRGRWGRSWVLLDQLPEEEGGFLSTGGSLPGLDRPGGMPVATLRQQTAHPEQAEGDTGRKSTGFPGQQPTPLLPTLQKPPHPPPDHDATSSREPADTEMRTP